MKNIIFSLGLLLFFTQCEKPSDCIKTTGPLTLKVLTDLSFDKIIVNKGIALVITQGPDYKVEIVTGQNLINDIEVNVLNRTLTLEDNTSCNWVRNYGQTTVYVTAPNLTDIYSKTELNITATTTLTYPYLHLVGMDETDGYKGVGTGDFILNLNNQMLLVENNDVSRYFLTGTTHDLTVNFYEYEGKFIGQNLLADTISIYHRGSNDMFLHPINSLTGGIYNIGNVYCNNYPTAVPEVAQPYRGKLFFY